MNKIINITISGYTGHGKTTIAQLIKDTLDSRDIHDVKIEEFPDDGPSSARSLERRLESLKDATVVIRTYQLNRGPVG